MRSSFYLVKKTYQGIATIPERGKSPDRQNYLANTIYPPGNGEIIFLGKDGRFERRKSNTVVFRGNFTLRRKEDCDGENKHVIYKTSESLTEFRIKIEDENLVLSTSACYADGGLAWYRRIN